MQSFQLIKPCFALAPYIRHYWILQDDSIAPVSGTDSAYWLHATGIRPNPILYFRTIGRVSRIVMSTL